MQTWTAREATRRLIAAGALLAATHAGAAAQNFAGYPALDDPLLFLLREPAVVRDLQLDADGRRRLGALNRRFDAALLASRGMPEAEATAQAGAVLASTRAELPRLLSEAQRTRLQQIAWRVQGIRFMVTPDAARELTLTAEQLATCTGVLEQTQEKLNDIQRRLQSGELDKQAAQSESRTVQEADQVKMLEALTEQQRAKLVELIGPAFDLSQLGKVRFLAPPLKSDGSWINSDPLENAALRGKVVAVHFWTFGCSNCIQNYPWYRQWQTQFKDRPFTLLGVHTPEFDHERDVERIREVVQQEQFAFPIVVDNDKRIWQAWGNNIWPAVYLLDKQGQIRYWWYGELNWQGAGGQDIMARRIEELLQEPGPTPVAPATSAATAPSPPTP